MKSIAANVAFQANSDKIGIEIVPAEGESINATLYYSVDGSNWTSWSEALTDKNNVVCNSPKFMFLKLSQACIITEN